MPSREGAPDAFYLFNSHFFNFQFTPHMVTPSGFATCCLKGFLHTAHGTGFRLACLQTKQLLIVLPGVLPSREGARDAGYPSEGRSVECAINARKGHHLFSHSYKELKPRLMQKPRLTAHVITTPHEINNFPTQILILCLFFLDFSKIALK